eukprot:TRINITY_DN19100_c0_g1_i1.p3 TRINITY_DN19100_c0_g1~~TRINITY_DN19100_c0_g1_i1.p3  ORF type:complete len:116 (+),score=17.81 TRINITY_DN19100_c0_g1_i1:53-400(+)
MATRVRVNAVEDGAEWVCTYPGDHRGILHFLFEQGDAIPHRITVEKWPAQRLEGAQLHAPAAKVPDDDVLLKLETDSGSTRCQLNGESLSVWLSDASRRALAEGGGRFILIDAYR